MSINYSRLIVFFFLEPACSWFPGFLASGSLASWLPGPWLPAKVTQKLDKSYTKVG